MSKEIDVGEVVQEIDRVGPLMFKLHGAFQQVLLENSLLRHRASMLEEQLASIDLSPLAPSFITRV